MNWRCNPEYWGLAGAGVLPLARTTGRFLVSFRSMEVQEPHTYGVIGGKLDPIEGAEYYDEDLDEWIVLDPDELVLEDPEDAALREFEEETCRPSFDLELIPLYIFEDPKVGFVYYNFLGLVEDEFIPCVNWETDRWEWVALEELLELEPKHFGLEALLRDHGALRLLREVS